MILFNQIVYRCYFLFLILAGTCGNLLTAIALLRAKLRKYTTCQFMAVCALFNIGVLLTNTLNMMLSQGYTIHVRSLFGFGWCRINAFVAQWIRGMASWTLVIVAFDRFQQSKTIRRAAPTQNTRRVFLTILVTGLTLVPFNLHYLFFAGSRVYLGDGTTFLACIFFKSSENKIQRIFARTSTWQELVTIIIVVKETKKRIFNDYLISSFHIFLALHFNINSQHIHYKKFFSSTSEQRTFKITFKKSNTTRYDDVISVKHWFSRISRTCSIVHWIKL